MADTKYLQKKGNTWRVVVEIPKPLREALQGKPRFIKSLGTESLSEANRIKHQHVAEFKRRIKLAEQGKADPLAAAIEAAIAFREAFASHDNEYLVHGDQESTGAEELLEVVNQEAQALLKTRGPEASRLFHSLATGKATLIRDQYPTWLAICNGTEQTKAQHEATIKRFLAWAGEFMSIEGTDRKKAGEYVQVLRDAKLAAKTIQRHLSSLATLWSWLTSRGLTSTSERDNPWRGHGVGKTPRGTKKKSTRTGLSNEKLLKLLRGRYSTPRYATILADLTRLALLHGSRLDELCALKKADIQKIDGDYWFQITEGKTEAAVRRVPLHPLAVPIIERRLKGPGKEYLFDGLVPGGPDRKRSWNASKAYGRFRKDVGVAARYEDFHALRKTFADLMEGLEVPERTVQLIIGHERGFTYGDYSSGQRVNLRKIINQVDYGSEVMAAIALPAPE
ncbi:Phage integrase [Rhodopseudomonas palustris HaA2]|uniref:Phage integrase n=1 Tax=Rhodopseudomonas palustris (strain HaA2) TaxID=316058 RepID=Q2J1M4_RHOP2|nr:tyrosine-type recombinase/integrase [Rhodopseudomonas palustris]ABD05636.1 Phage integrase [Rhodopseudomonas palustris HaA2]